jgi:hypothetical protein
MNSVLFFLIYVCHITYALPEQGKFVKQWTKDTHIVYVSKSLFNQSSIHLKVHCSSDDDILVNWVLRFSPCAEEFAEAEGNEDKILAHFDKPEKSQVSSEYYQVVSYKQSLDKRMHSCSEKIIYGEYNPRGATVVTEKYTHTDHMEDSIIRRDGQKTDNSSVKDIRPSIPQDLISYTWQDGSYLLAVQLTCGSKPNKLPCNLQAEVTIEMKSWYGYLSAIERPLLIFYGCMCGVYCIYSLFWLVVSACYWRDLLRVQFWIGGVIFLGLLEKAFFIAEYQTINNKGVSVAGAVWFAELVSCLKRTLARLLVMVVCIGYGIVKPRLGAALRQVVILGVAYFLFSIIEGTMRVMQPRFQLSRKTFWTVIPLAITDAIIFVMTFTYLVQTIRQMRMRRNTVKFSLYRHFSNLLIILVLASVVFMGWSMYDHKLFPCIKNWRELWVDEAFWHLLFSIMLAVIIWLWRPSKNNIRYAYSPVLDADNMEGLSDDEVADTNDEVNMENVTSGDIRRKPRDNGNTVKKSGSTVDDDLKWIEEHIPASVAERSFPLLDSDEERQDSKLLASKME